MQKHDIGCQKQVKNEKLNPKPLSKRERLEKKKHALGLHKEDHSKKCRLCRVKYGVRNDKKKQTDPFLWAMQAPQEARKR